MKMVTNKLNAVIAIFAVGLGLFLTPIPMKLGFYRWMTTKDPAAIGLTPAHHYGIPWGYTFQDYYSHCDEIRGQRALVTGSNSGIGFAVARSLAKCGVEVIMACRNEQRCQSAAEDIRKDTNGVVGTKVSTMVVDTSSLSSVQKFSKKFLDENQERPLDMLFLNAGRGVVFGHSTDPGSLILSEDGIEIYFATNYLGHHLMWLYLEPLVTKAPTGRVVLTSSAASFDTFPCIVATSIAELHGQGLPQTNMKYYGHSKLAQIMWGKKVTRNLLESDSETFVNSVHPGLVDTPIFDKLNVWPMFNRILNFVRKLGWTNEEGALTLLYLGTEPEKMKDLNVRGKYFHPQSQEVVNELSLDEELQDKLWSFSNKLVADFAPNE